MSEIIKETLRVKTDDGKYTVVQYEDGVISVDRNEQHWLPRVNELEMAKVVLQLAYDLEATRKDFKSRTDEFEQCKTGYKILKDQFDTLCKEHSRMTS